ncbi:MAG: hypothetical protein IKT27_01470 [Clostridia bacterium]|nr:hypothetical protein [Clostridia bacterium]
MTKLYSQKLILQSALKAKEKERFELVENLVQLTQNFNKTQMDEEITLAIQKLHLAFGKIYAGLFGGMFAVGMGLDKLFETIDENASAIAKEQTAYLTEVSNDLKANYGIEIAPNPETFMTNLEIATSTNPQLLEAYQQSLHTIPTALGNITIGYLTPEFLFVGAGFGLVAGLGYYFFKSRKIKAEAKYVLNQIEEEQQIALDSFDAEKRKVSDVQKQINKITSEITQIEKQLKTETQKEQQEMGM